MVKVMTNLLVKKFIKDADNINDPKVRRHYGELAGTTGIILNLILFTIKLLAGIFSASVAVTADAFNNLSDAGSSIVMLIGFKLSTAPADKDHPFGHGRMEYLSGFIISLLIMLMGVEFIKTSWAKIINPSDVEFGLIPIVILIVSVLIKIWMSVFNYKLGTRINSGAMKATYADSLSDAVSTSVVLIGTLIGYYLNIAIDGYLGIVVALFILYTGFNTARESVSSLLGAPPDEDFVKAIRDEVAQFPEIVGMHDLVIHNYGPGRSMISFHAEVPCNADIIKMHDVIDLVELRIRERFGATTTIHMDPIATDDNYTNEQKAIVSELVKQIDERLSIHDFRIVKGAMHTNLIFDVVMPHKFNMTSHELESRIMDAVNKHDATCFAVVHAEHSYT